MSRMVVGLAVLAMSALPASASAFGWRLGRTAYYYSAPPVVAYSPVVYCVPAYAAAVTAPLMPAPRLLAQPVPAPPSRQPMPPRTQEPPLSNPSGPGVSESRKSPSMMEAHAYFNAYSVTASDTARPGSDRCRVSFWNLTDRAIIVKAGDRSHLLQRNSQSAPLELDRHFVWRMDEREPRQARVPDGEAGLVIVIRR